MQLCSGAVSVHRRGDVCDDGEAVQSVAVNAAGTILAVVTQTHLHFWSAGPKTVYLTSLSIPGTSLEDNPALYVLWRQRQGNHLAVITSRQVVFFEADINVKPAAFLQVVERRRSSIFIHHVDSASRVCYSSAVTLEAGLVSSAVAAGPYAFLVTTTAGVVYVVGWHQQDILHQWTTVGLQSGDHTFTTAAEEQEEANALGCGSFAQRGRGGTPRTPGASASVNSNSNIAALTRQASASTSSNAGTAATSSAASPLSSSVPVHRDPLQRRYPRDANVFALQRKNSSLVVVQNTVPEPANGISGAGGTSGAAPIAADTPLDINASLGILSRGIRPPGTAVRARENVFVSESTMGSPSLAASAPSVGAGAPGNFEKLEPQHQESVEADGDTTVVRRSAMSSPLVAVAGASVEVGSKTHSFAGSTFDALEGTASRAHADKVGNVKNNSNDGTAGASARRSAGAEQLSGTLLHASFAARWKVLSFVFSCGNVLLCRPSCGTNFTHSKVQLQGCVSPIVSVSMVSLNMRHLLLAVCTQAGALSCRRIDSVSLAVSSSPLWKGVRGVQDGFSKYASSGGPAAGAPSAGGASSSSASQSLGLIAAMEWSPSEELLCVAFYKYGVVLVHYSGGVLTHHLAGWDTPIVLREPSAVGPSDGPAVTGCSSITWKPDGARLWMTAPGQPCFFSVQLSRVLAVDTVGPLSGNHTPLALLADDGLFLVSVSEATGRQGVRELVLLPSEYTRDQFPLLYGAVSSDGSWVACAGRRGMVIFNRERYSWKVASKKAEEAAFSCVVDPVWLRNVAVAVPALRTDTKTYELLVFSTASVSPSNALARVALDGRPVQLSCVHQDHRSEGYVVVVDSNQTVRVFRYDVFVDSTGASVSSAIATPNDSNPSKLYVALTPVQNLTLTAGLSNPLQVIPVYLRTEEDDRANPLRTQDAFELRLLLHRRIDHALVWLRADKSAASGGTANATRACPAALPAAGVFSGGTSPVNATSEPFQPAAAIRAPFVYHFWVDRTAPVRGAVLLTHEDGDGLVLYQMQQPSLERSTAASVAPLIQRVEVTPTRDTELLPLCVSPFDGYMLCIGTDTSIPRPSRCGPFGGGTNVSPHPQLLLRPVLYAHRILSLLLLAALPTTTTTTISAPRLGAPLPSGGPGATTDPLLRGTASTYDGAAGTTTTTTAEVDGRVASFLWDRTLFYWLEKMRHNDTFGAVMDYFLHTALNESPPAAVPGLSRRSAVRAVIALVRNYPEFYTIVVGSVRKIDFSRWHLVLDFLGTPTALFHECVAHHCYAEAVHLVRVIMMGSFKPAEKLSLERVAELRALGNDPLAASTSSTKDSATANHTGGGALEQASRCAVKLFALSVENGDYTAAYDLLRFMALLEEEIGMPAAAVVDYDHGGVVCEARGGGGGSNSAAAAAAAASEGFLTRWLRQLTFSGAAYDDPEAAMDEGTEEEEGIGGGGGGAATTPSAVVSARAGGSANGAKAKRGSKASMSRIARYPTLVLDVARCEASGQGGAAGNNRSSVPAGGHTGGGAEDANEEAQRQAAVRHMFHRHRELPAAVHQEALRLLRTGYVAQLVKLMETFSFSMPRFLLAAGKLLNLKAAAAGSGDDSFSSNEASGDGTGTSVTLHLRDVFDGLHKELGLPRSFHVLPTVSVATDAANGIVGGPTSWSTWLVEQQTKQAARLPGVLSATNPKVWTVAQSLLYATPNLLRTVESLHRLFRNVFVYNLAFSVLLMRKSDLISLLLPPLIEAPPAAAATEVSTPTVNGPKTEAEVDSPRSNLINVLDHLESLLAVPENVGYKPFLQDVFQSLPPSALRASEPTPSVSSTTNTTSSAAVISAADARAT